MHREEDSDAPLPEIGSFLQVKLYQVRAYRVSYEREQKKKKRRVYRIMRRNIYFTTCTYILLPEIFFHSFYRSDFLVTIIVIFLQVTGLGLKIKVFFFIFFSVLYISNFDCRFRKTIKKKLSKEFAIFIFFENKEPKSNTLNIVEMKKKGYSNDTDRVRDI